MIFDDVIWCSKLRWIVRTFKKMFLINIYCEIYDIGPYIIWKLSADTDRYHINGLVQDCSVLLANALEILQSCTKPRLWCWWYLGVFSYKIPTYQYRNSHYKGETASWPPAYLYSVNPYIRKDCLFIETGPRLQIVIYRCLRDRYVKS